MERILTSQPERGCFAHGDSPVALAEHVVRQAMDTFRAAEISDYRFAISVEGARTYCASGQACTENEIASTPAAHTQIACLIRPLMAAVALELAQDGRLDLRARIGNLLPELSTDGKGALIQVQHLISNTAGYMGYSRMPAAHAFSDRAAALIAISRAPQIFWPGLVYSYDNSAPTMLGEILANISKRTIPDLVEELIFSPLGIKSRAPQAEDEGIPVQASSFSKKYTENRSLFASLLSFPDLVRFVESLMGDVADGRKTTGLSIPTLKALRRPVVAIPRTTSSSASRLLPTAYGLGLEVFQNGFVGYDTSTGSQANGFRFDRTRQIAVVLSTSGRFRSFRRALLGRLVELLGDATNPTQDAAVERHDESNLTVGEIVGDYFGDHSFHASVRQRDGSIVFTVHSAGGGRLELWGQKGKNGDLHFDSKVPGAEPTFFRYSRTGEACVMFGMYALKRLPTLSFF